MSDLSNAILDFTVRHSTDGGKTFTTSPTYDLRFRLVPSGYNNFTIFSNPTFNELVKSIVGLDATPNMSQFVLVQLNSNYPNNTIMHQMDCTLEGKIVKIRLRTPIILYT